MDKKTYEMMFILRPDLGEQETQAQLEEIRSLITSEGGEITMEDLWGIREFAYTIKKYDEGYYGVFNFSLAPSKLSTLDQPLNINKDVLRYMVVSVDHNYNFKNIEEYEEEAQKRKEKEEKEGPRNDSGSKLRAPRKPVKADEEAPKKAKAAPKKEEKAEKAEKTDSDASSQKESKEKLKEVDEKLKNIINDPDITL